MGVEQFDVRPSRLQQLLRRDPTRRETDRTTGNVGRLDAAPNLGLTRYEISAMTPTLRYCTHCKDLGLRMSKHIAVLAEAGWPHDGVLSIEGHPEATRDSVPANLDKVRVTQ